MYALNAHLPRNGIGRALVVAGQHDHLDAEAAERFDRGLGVRLHRIGDRDEPGRLCVDRHVHRCFPFSGESLPGRFKRLNGHPPILHQPGVPQEHVMTIDSSADTVARNRRKTDRQSEGEAPGLGTLDDRLTQRMLRPLLKGRSQAKHIIVTVPARYDHIRQRRFSAGDGPCLVEDDRVKLLRTLQRIA